MTNPCCGRAHAWDSFRVEQKWLPARLRCYVVGENPGDAESAYFYEEARAVPVRTIVLRELHQRGQIDAPTLSAFRDGGFLFDHAVRCDLPPDEVATERTLAERHASTRCGAATHLRPWVARTPSVWVMGYMARNAVTALGVGLAKDLTKIRSAPYPCWFEGTPRFFVSRYVTRTVAEELGPIFSRLVAGLASSKRR